MFVESLLFLVNDKGIKIDDRVYLKDILKELWERSIISTLYSYAIELRLKSF